jgi:NADPH:quinone reductase-like Zn-dependent oxidoreductase
MSNLAAILPSAKARLEVHEVEKYTPGPNELLIKNTCIAFNPLEWKIIKFELFPLQYPSILGFSYGGEVEAVGNPANGFSKGDFVVTSRRAVDNDNKYGGYQRYVVASADAAIKLASAGDLEKAASGLTNFLAVVAILNIKLGMGLPSLNGPPPKNGKKLLVYGGSSSVGSLAIQYATQAGYTVTSTSSPRNLDFVLKVGAEKVVDHTQAEKDVVALLTAEGPFDFTLDAISLPSTVNIVVSVLAAQKGGTFATMMPGPENEVLPEGVTRIYDAYPFLLEREENKQVKKWVGEFFPKAIASGSIVPTAVQKVDGGLDGANAALDRLERGVSGVKLIANPWE